MWPLRLSRIMNYSYVSIVGHTNKTWTFVINSDSILIAKLLNLIIIKEELPLISQRFGGNILGNYLLWGVCPIYISVRAFSRSMCLRIENPPLRADQVFHSQVAMTMTKDPGYVYVHEFCPPLKYTNKHVTTTCKYCHKDTILSVVAWK